MKTLSVITLFALSSALSLAAGKAASGGGPVHNSDGCGSGWQWTKKKTLFATTSRGSTNGNGVQSFAMSSGTMGCQKHEFAANEQTAVDFAAANFDSLQVEMAEGNGEFVAGLASAMGCPTQEFGAKVQENFGSLVNTSSGVGMYRNVKEMISKDSSLSAVCNIG